MMIELLAKTDPDTARWLAVALFVVKFLLTSLALFLATHALRGIPMLDNLLRKSWAGLIVYLLVLAAAGFLTFWLVSLRILQSLALLPDPKTLLWADVILSALALAQLSMLWPAFVEWLTAKDRKG
ncbi:MAG: hypothetical protein NXI24_17380 [bacterium]|nr:hypothetical protein [bacterium]